MIRWKEAKVERPQDMEDCFITVQRNSKFTAPILGPIMYREDSDGFLDLFATEHEGAHYSVTNLDLWWCPEFQINLPGEYE